MTPQTDGYSGRPRISLEPTWHHQLLLDGCWRPRSTDLETELPSLVAALDGARGPLVRLRLSAAGWSSRPHHVRLGERTVTLGYFSDQPRTMLTVVCADGGVVTLLVIPALADEQGREQGDAAGVR